MFLEWCLRSCKWIWGHLWCNAERWTIFSTLQCQSSSQEEYISEVSAAAFNCKTNYFYNIFYFFIIGLTPLFVSICLITYCLLANQRGSSVEETTSHFNEDSIKVDDCAFWSSSSFNKYPKWKKKERMEHKN